MGKIAEDEKVDFVILWVDGNDPEWQASKAKSTADKGQDASANRYREWEWKNLHRGSTTSIL